MTGYYPQNKLTEYLLNLRQYRPQSVQRFFRDLEAKVADGAVHAAFQADPDSIALLLGVVEQIFLFRNGHWQFVQRYILAQTQHKTATGGTPITTWLPNQLEACLKYMEDLLAVALAFGEAAFAPENVARLSSHARRTPRSTQRCPCS